MDNNRALKIKSGNITCELLVPDHDIMSWLCGFGHLQYGTLSLSEFNRRFNFNRKVLIEKLKDADNLIKNTQELENIAYQLYLIRVSQRENWRWPIIINHSDSMVDWENGNARCVATGMTRARPWECLPVLFWGNSGSTNQFSTDSISIDNDEQLHTALAAQESTASLGVKLDNGKLKLIWVHNGTWDQPISKVSEVWNGYWQWFEQYLQNTRPKLVIYTDYPDLISDHNSVWDIDIKPRIDSSFHPAIPEKLASLEKSLYQQHQTGAFKEHTLIVQTPVDIDVGDLLCWMNLDYTVFCHPEWDFVLCRPGSQYTSTFINVSSVKY